MLGVKFHEVDTFLLKMSFTNCQLGFSSFRELNMNGTYFKNCTLEEVNFSNTVLTSAVFESSVLKNTIFDQSILEKVDFRTAKYLRIDPDVNKLKGAKFSKENVIGLLDKYKISIE